MNLEQMSLEQMADELVAHVPVYNASQDNPLQLPEGWHKVLDRRGESAGYGFYCPKCKLHSPYGLNENSVVKHCGTATEFPGLVARLRMKTHRIVR